MKDARSVLDGVRSKVSSAAKMLVVYFGDHGELVCAQSNCSQADLSVMVNSLQANIMSEKVGQRR